MRRHCVVPIRVAAVVLVPRTVRHPPPIVLMGATAVAGLLIGAAIAVVTAAAPAVAVLPGARARARVFVWVRVAPERALPVTGG